MIRRGRVQAPEDRRGGDGVGRGHDRARARTRRRPRAPGSRPCAIEADDDDREQHEPDRQQRDRPAVRAQVAQRRQVRRDEHQWRQEDEQDDVAARASTCGQARGPRRAAEAAEHEQDRIGDPDLAPTPRRRSARRRAGRGSSSEGGHVVEGYRLGAGLNSAAPRRGPTIRQVFEGAVRSGTGVRIRSNVPVPMPRRRPPLGRPLRARRRRPVPDDPDPHAVRQLADRRTSSRARAPRRRGLRRRDPGLPRPLRLRGRLRPVPQRGPGRLRHPGVDRRAAVVERPDRHDRRLVRAAGRSGRRMPLGSRFLTAIVPSVMATNLHRGLVYRGGALNLGVLLTWGLRTSGHTRQRARRSRLGRGVPDAAAVATPPLAAAQDIPHWRDWLAHEAEDEWWDAVRPRPPLGRACRRPALVTGGWYDLYSSDTFTSFARAAGARHGRRASEPPRRRAVAARPERIDDAPAASTSGPAPCSISTASRTAGSTAGCATNATASTTNRRYGSSSWAPTSGGTATDWPLPGTELAAAGISTRAVAANTLQGDGTLSTDTPGRRAGRHASCTTPTTPCRRSGGCNCCQPDIIPWGPYDQRDVEMRSDVLVYTSAPLERDLTVIGPVRVVLWAATDGPTRTGRRSSSTSDRAASR